MKKGFTMVELIAVIAILGTIACIAIPNYLNVLNEKSDKLYEISTSQIEEAAKEYMINNPTLYKNVETNGSLDINITELCTSEFLDCPVNDPRNNGEIKGHVHVTITDDVYDYEFVSE